LAFPPGLGGAMAMTLKRLRIGREGEGVGRGVLFPGNGREIVLVFEENLTEVEKNEEEEEEHKEGQEKISVDAIQSFPTRVEFG